MQYHNMNRKKSQIIYYICSLPGPPLSKGSVLDGTNGSKRGMLKGYKGGTSYMGDMPVGSR